MGLVKGNSKVKADGKILHFITPLFFNFLIKI